MRWTDHPIVERTAWTAFVIGALMTLQTLAGCASYQGDLKTVRLERKRIGKPTDTIQVVVAPDSAFKAQPLGYRIRVHLLGRKRLVEN